MNFILMSNLEMKKSLLERISTKPEENVKRIEQFWDFIENDDK